MACLSGVANPRAIFVLPTPIKFKVLANWLKDYYNVGDADCLRSVASMPTVTLEKINSEIQAGRVAGPFVQRLLEHLQCSPIGLVPKRNRVVFGLFTTFVSKRGWH